MTAIVVLYEDQRVANQPFGPHELLMGMVADDIERPWHMLAERATAKPLKGRDSVLEAIRTTDRWRALAPGSVPVLAILDADKVDDVVGGRRRSAAEVERAIRSRCPEPDRLTVVLLQDNLETVIAAVRECDFDRTLDAVLVAQALRKILNARDRLLAKVGRDPGRRSIRDCVRKRVPSLNKAVAAIQRALAR